MLNFNHFTKTQSATLVALLLATLGLGGVARAQQVTVTGTVSLFNAATGYTYNYSITNGAPMDLAEITVPANPQSSLLNLTAPTGFLITFDSGNGLFSFLEDNNQNTPQTFASGTTVTGFSFTSFYAPGAATFDALDAGANDYMGTTLAPTVVPEPTTTLLSLAGLALVGGIVVRRRLSTQSVSIQ